jgi:hypothetical protein
MMARRVRSEHERAWAVKIGQLLAEVLRAHDLTPATFAKAVDVPATKVYRWLNGTENPHLDRFLQFDDLHVAIVVGIARLIDGVDVAPGRIIDHDQTQPTRSRQALTPFAPAPSYGVTVVASPASVVIGAQTDRHVTSTGNN